MPSQIRSSTGKGARAATGAGLAAGLAGIVASSCCVLPIVFVGLGLGSVAAALIPTLAILRPYLLGAAALAIVVSWVTYARRRQALPSRGVCGTGIAARRVPLWLVLATAVVLLAFIWQPWIEPLLLRAMRS
jgi:mercuric ion transport protein